jgi:bacillolysin
MKKVYFLILLAILVGAEAGTAQNVPTVRKQDNQQIKEIASKVDDAGWVFLKKEKKISPDDVFVSHKDAFGLQAIDEMKKVKTKIDEFGMKHHTFQQYYKGIPVEHYTYLVHERDNIAEIVNGEILENINIDITPLIDDEKAFGIALSNFKSNKWAWEDKDWEEEMSTNKKNPSWKPTGELLIIDSKVNQPNPGILVFRYDLLSIDPYFHYAVYINARTGAVEKKTSLIRNESTGTVYTLYNGTKSFTTKYRGLPNWDYILKDETRGYICTKLYSFESWNNRPYIDNHNNTWHVSGTEVKGATAQWAAERAYDYFHTNFSRHGLDNNNKQLRIHLHFNDNFPTGWVPGNSNYDDIHLNSYRIPSIEKFIASLDAVGHEFTHGVTYSEAGLVYEKESGALDESFSDIFGTMIEKSVETSTWDWTIGEDYCDSTYLRSMSDPNSKLHPSTYCDTFWVDVSTCVPTLENDFCGVHANAGVQNHWFYLLSNGGTQNGVTVSPIGTEKAAHIAYYNLTYYLSSQSNYASARNGSIMVATSAYGKCSNEYQQVMNAWAAVGVGDPAVPCLSATITGPSQLSYGQYGYWDAIVHGGTGNYSYEWYIDWALFSNSASISCGFYPDVLSYYVLQLIVTEGSLFDCDEAFLVEVYPEGMQRSYSSEPITLSITPNPADEVALLQISINDETLETKDLDITVNLVDASGRIIMNLKTKNKTLEFSTANLKNGVYTVVASIGNQKTSTNLVVNH